MGKIKTLVVSSVLLGASLLGVSSAASAKDVHIANQTDGVLSFSVNGACSQALSVVLAHTIEKLDTKNLTKACGKKWKTCTIDIHSGDVVSSLTCSGSAVGTFTLNWLQGIDKLTGNGVTLRATGNDLFVS